METVKRRRLPKKWPDGRIEDELRAVAQQLGHFPSCPELRALNRNDLMCAMNKRDSVAAWAERIGMKREHSDSDTGWEGEIAFMDLVKARGITCERPDHVKHPFDLLAGGVLRIDVKAARFATYRNSKSGGTSSGWFYRIGKAPQADVVILYQLDTGNFYGLPWWLVPTSNITTSRSGGKYAAYLNNWAWIESILSSRLSEMKSGVAESAA